MDDTDHALFPRFSAELVATALKDTPVVMVTSGSRPHRNSFPLLFTSVHTWKLTPQLIRTLSIRPRPDAYEGVAIRRSTPESDDTYRVSDDNSTPEQNIVRADRVELPSAS